MDARLIGVRGIVVALLLVLPLSVLAQPIERSRAAVHTFRGVHACPATGLHRGACPGWQVDHVQPLCSGGPDTRANMQWLSVDDHRLKTRQDLRVCRYLRKIIPKEHHGPI